MTPTVVRRTLPDRIGVALTCSGCNQPLAHFTETAYGLRATCGCPDVRWTALRERRAVVPEWVPEKRHPMTPRKPHPRSDANDFIDPQGGT